MKYEVSTLAVDGWVVTFGTARRPDWAAGQYAAATKLQPAACIVRK